MQAQACDSCHRRKSRCDKVKPACGYCQKNHAQCVYTDRSKEPTFRKHHIEAVERRLRQAEAKNQALAQELARSRASSEPPDRSDGVPRSKSISAIVSDRPSASETTTAGGDVMNEVTFLASTAAGERHYLGSTSGILFANLVRASVDVSNHNPPPPGSQVRDTQQELTASSPSASTAFKETLPLPELAKKLVSAYLSHDHLCYPFLSPHALLSIVDSIYNDSSFYTSHAYESFVFDLVLAIATANVYKFDWQMLPSAETHHTRAMARITEVFQAGGLKSLQAILLLCQYRTGSSMQDTSASMWHLVGIAVRICFELGFHRESTYASNPSQEEREGLFEALRDQEVRRRCFWSVFAMDRIVGITLGRPLAIHLDDIDVALPSAENDHVLVSSLDLQGDSAGINRTAIFVHITEYRLLCGRIIKSLHGLKRSDHDENQMYSLRERLVADLDRWRQRTENLGLSTMSQDRSSFRAYEWYEMLYCNAMLFLFRPSPMLSDITRDSKSLHNIFSSSKQAISLYAYLHRSRKINYSWITLHSVFMAGLSYIYAVSRHFRERRRGLREGSLLASDPSAIEIVNDTRACSNVLVAVSERWNALRHCHEVFDRLSDAVLVDAIKLQCTPNLAHAAPPGESLITPQPTNSGHSRAGLVPTSFNNFDESSAMSLPSSAYPGMSPLAVDSEFRNCFDDLRNLYDQSYVDDPVMQLSQDWLGYIDGFNNLMPPETMPDQYMGATY